MSMTVRIVADWIVRPEMFWKMRGIENERHD